MTAESGKADRLTAVARMYYERNMTQNEIAREINVSRPMVSKLLAQAREVGIVTIIIDDSADECPRLAKRIQHSMDLKKVVVVPESEDDAEETENRLAVSAFEQIKSMSEHGGRLGLGWGKFIRRICRLDTAPIFTGINKVAPLMGGFNSPLAFEHCNGLAFDLAEMIGAEAEPVYIPAVLTGGEEKAAAMRLPAYSEAQSRWDDLDAAVLEIFPPEDSGGPVGSVLGYGFDFEGGLSQREDSCFGAGIEQIKKAGNRLAVASAETIPEVILSALKTGLFTHAVITDRSAESILMALDR